VGQADAGLAARARELEHRGLEGEGGPGRAAGGAMTLVGGQPITTAQALGHHRPRRGGQADDVGVGQDLVGQVLGSRAQFCGGDEAGRNTPAHLGHHLRPSPRRALLAKGGEHVDGQRLAVERRRRSRPIEHGGKPAIPRLAGGVGLRHPPHPQRLGVVGVVAFRRPGLVRRPLVLRRPLGRGQAPSHADFGGGHPDTAPGLDLLAASGEVALELLRHPHDIGMAVGAGRLPFDAQTTSQLGSKGGLVDATRRLLLGEQVTPVEGSPRTVGPTDLGRDE